MRFRLRIENISQLLSLKKRLASSFLLTHS